jgi:hypothetical protein
MSAVAGRSWVWKDEENRMEYAITIEDFDSNANIITRLRLERFYKPLGLCFKNKWGHVWIVEFDKEGPRGELRVKCIERAYEWNGTYVRTKYVVSIKTDFIELPWFINKDELEDEIGHHDVKYGIQAVLGYIKDLFTIYLKTPEELPEKIG